jgi:hypothetical protein
MVSKTINLDSSRINPPVRDCLQHRRIQSLRPADRGGALQFRGQHRSEFLFQLGGIEGDRRKGSENVVGEPHGVATFRYFNRVVLPLDRGSGSYGWDMRFTRDALWLCDIGFAQRQRHDIAPATAKSANQIHRSICLYRGSRPRQSHLQLFMSHPIFR